MRTFPAAWEDALWAAARERLGEGPLDPRALARAIAERTRRYTSDRAELSRPLPPTERPRDLAARALFFTVADAAKIAVPLAELAMAASRLPTSASGSLPRFADPAAPLRVLDVGAGCGAMSLGVRAVRHGPLEVVAVDRDADALALFARAVALGPDPFALETIAADVDAPLPARLGRFDLVVLGSVLNELTPERAQALVVRLLEDRLADGGALVIVEPALRETARRLHALRDALVASGRSHVFAPCTRTGPCPALDDPRDWCHEDRPFVSPPRLARLATATGLRQGGLKFAYLTLRLEPGSPVEVPAGRRALRVVSEPLDTKGVTARVVCGEGGRAELRLLKRPGLAEARRALGRSVRGDVLLLGGGRGDGQAGGREDGDQAGRRGDGASGDAPLELEVVRPGRPPRDDEG